jgi:hypothetical protein
MEQWWQVLLPGALRPEADRIDFQEGAILVQRYGIYEGGSAPFMLFADFYSRFGWTSIFVLSCLVGFVLIKFDGSLRRQSGSFRLIFWALYSPLIFGLTNGTALHVFVTCTRDFVIVFVLAKIVSIVCRGTAKPTATASSRNVVFDRH